MMAKATVTGRALVLVMLAGAAQAADVNVSTSQQLIDAIGQATAGTTIHVANGHYSLSAAVWTNAAGTAQAPIVLSGESVAGTKIDVDALEGLVINHAYWVVEKIWLNGVCTGGCVDSAGLHIKATADHFIGRSMHVSNFGEDIKGDRTPSTEVSDCAILNSEIENTSPDMGEGGTGIDLVGGKRWRIVGNYVHDYARDGVHYAIFLKGGTSDGVIEKNLVIGAKDLPHGSGAEVGISFGGGGTGPQYCATGNSGASFCTCEDFGGVARNNFVINVNDSAFHTKVACGSSFVNNTVYGSSPGLQIQIAGATGSIGVHNNVFSGGISGTVSASDNALNVSETDFAKFYANPAQLDFSQGPAPSGIKDKGPALALVTDDYFGTARSGTNDWGAVEFPAAGAVWPWGGMSQPSDAGTGGGAGGGGGSLGDAGAGGGSGSDAGTSHDAGSGGGAGGGSGGGAGGGSGGGAGGGAGGGSGGGGGGQDAGLNADAGVTGPGPATGCGCTSGNDLANWLVSVALALLVARRIRRQINDLHEPGQ